MCIPSSLRITPSVARSVLELLGSNADEITAMPIGDQAGDSAPILSKGAVVLTTPMQVECGQYKVVVFIAQSKGYDETDAKQFLVTVCFQQGIAIVNMCTIPVEHGEHITRIDVCGSESNTVTCTIYLQNSAGAEFYEEKKVRVY